MNVRELLTKSLEDAEFDIYQASDIQDVDTARKKALADIYGGQEAELFTETEAESWRKRIREVATFRWASLEWREDA